MVARKLKRATSEEMAPIMLLVTDLFVALDGQETVAWVFVN